MVREPPRKCSFCGQHGHNSRTCNNKASLTQNNNNNDNNETKSAHCVKLFGVNINDEKVSSDSIKKSQSMGNLVAREHRNKEDLDSSDEDDQSGYLSDGLIHNKRRKAAHERKKGTPWSEEEHRTFLMGLNDLGKGDWRGISMKYVHTRTPTQVASHAQKYFLRQNASERKKRRSSLFDMPFTPDESMNSSSQMKINAESSQLACRPQFLPGNSSSELMQRFPHLCLDKYPVPISPASNYQPELYHYNMGIQGTVQAWPVNMLSYVTPSYAYNNATNVPIYNATSYNNNINNSNNVAVINQPNHPSGIPPARNPVAIKGDGLELRIALPQSKTPSAPTSPASLVLV